MGDPAGVGPELAVKLLADPAVLSRAQIYLLADSAEIIAAASEADVDVPLSDTPAPGHVVPLPSGPFPAVRRAAVSRESGSRCLTDLQYALDLHAQDIIDAVMFLPMNKSALRLAGMEEEDELRWLAKQLNHAGTTSELNTVDGLWTARVTSHMPLRDVADHITAPNVAAATRLLDRTLKDTGIAAPRIAVCALNPHAGENGNFGREEIEEIEPGVQLARAEGIDASGPFPCDTLFIKARAGHFDGVLTMYHDQGQIALKTIGFDRGVTVQGGLPVPIATPSAGTAFDIVGKGVANTGATMQAFDVTLALASKAAERALQR